MREEGPVLAISSLFHNSHLLFFSVLFILGGAPHLPPGRQISFPTLFLQPNPTPSFFGSAGHPPQLSPGAQTWPAQGAQRGMNLYPWPPATAPSHQARDSPAAHQPSGVCPLMPRASCPPPAFLQAHGRPPGLPAHPGLQAQAAPWGYGSSPNRPFLGTSIPGLDRNNSSLPSRREDGRTSW